MHMNNITGMFYTVGKTRYEIQYFVDRGIRVKLLDVLKYGGHGFPKNIGLEKFFSLMMKRKPFLRDEILVKIESTIASELDHCSRYSIDVDGGQAVVVINGVQIRVPLGGDGSSTVLVDNDRWGSLADAIGGFEEKLEVRDVDSVKFLTYDCGENAHEINACGRASSVEVWVNPGLAIVVIGIQKQGGSNGQC